MKKKPGFRLSLIDVVFLLVSACVCYYLFLYDSSIGWLVAMPVIAFFCFCNIFRVRRMPEFIWAGCYMVLAPLGFILDMIYLITVMGSSLLILLIAILEMYKPWYHGVGYSLINPDVTDW